MAMEEKMVAAIEHFERGEKVSEDVSPLGFGFKERKTQILERKLCSCNRRKQEMFCW
jgi:hypothetical protein